MSVPTPLVSILMAVRNGEPFIEEALESLLSQQGVAFELVIVDDGSTDGTSERLAACKDPRLAVIRHQGQGLVSALNTGIAALRGKYVARMDSDDVCLPHRLARQVAILDADPSVDMVHSSTQVIDENGRGGYVIGVRAMSRNGYRSLLLGERTGKPIINPTVMMRLDSFQASGGYRDSPSCEDHEFWLRVVDRWKIVAIPDVMVRYRQHLTGISRTRTTEQAISNLTNCIAYRFRCATDLDLYDQAPKRYQALRALVEKRAGKMLEAASLAKSARRDFRQGRWRNALASIVQLADQRGLFLLSNRVLRKRILALQLDLLTDFEKSR